MVRKEKDLCYKGSAKVFWERSLTHCLTWGNWHHLQVACFPFSVADLTPSGSEQLEISSSAVFKKQHDCRQRSFAARRWRSFS